MKEAVARKLKSKDGASLAVALLFFVLCGVGASVILAASSAAAGKLEQVPQTDQKRFTVESAAAFLRDQVKAKENQINIHEVLVEDSRSVDSTSDQVSISYAGGGTGDGQGSLLLPFVSAYYEPLGDATLSGSSEKRTFTMKVSANESENSENTDLSVLTANVEFSMDSDYSVRAKIWDNQTDTKSHPEDLCTRYLTAKAQVTENTDVSVESYETTDEEGNILEEWTITTTTRDTGICWTKGKISAAEDGI